MKTIILGAGMGTRLGNMTETMPKCLIPFKDTTLLEHSIKILSECGLHDIIVVSGYKSEQVIKKWANTVINTEYETTQPPYSVKVAIQSILDDKVDDLIIIDGDLVYNEKLIKKLLEYNKTCVVSYTASSKTEMGSRILINNKKVTQIGRYISPPFPYQIHAGITYIKKEHYETYKQYILKPCYKKTEMHILLNDLCKEIPIGVFSVDNEHITKLQIDKQLDGGSFSQIIKTHDDSIIKKESKKDVTRLVNELEFLNNLPENIKNYFTEIIDYSIKKDSVWYTMKYYNLLSLKKLILQNKMVASTVVEFIDDLLRFLFYRMYLKHREKNVSNNYVESVHFSRFFARKRITIQRASVFEKIFNAKKIYLNNVEYDNAEIIIKKMLQSSVLLHELKPPYLTMIHGDLHFDNILVDPVNTDNFKLVDPKGFKQGDPMYDMAKIIHDVNGLYDFIYEYLFDLKYEIVDDTMKATLKIHDCKAKDIFEQIHNPILFKINKFFHDDSNWYLRLKFIEAINFTCLQPFHLVNDGFEKKAIAMYLMGVKLINHFWNTLPEVMKRQDKKLKIVNINTIEDYTYAQNLFSDNQFPGV